MKLTLKELQGLKGVGDILAQRFIKAGYDTFDKVAAAGEEGLRKIQGINPRMIQPKKPAKGLKRPENH